MTLRLLEADLGTTARGWFSGAGPDADDETVDYDRPGNLSHRRPHTPARLAQSRAELASAVGVSTQSLVRMEQPHGRDVAAVESQAPSFVRGVDGLFTDRLDVALVVEVADCVPVLIATPNRVAAVHAGRRGVEADIIGRTVAMLVGDGGPSEVVAAIGPAIGGCCYEVPTAMIDSVVAASGDAARTVTTWGTGSVDLPTAAQMQLVRAGVRQVSRAGSCTHCTAGWFSHRADPQTGRQVGIVVRAIS